MNNLAKTISLGSGKRSLRVERPSQRTVQVKGGDLRRAGYGHQVEGSKGDRPRGCRCNVDTYGSRAQARPPSKNAWNSASSQVCQTVPAWTLGQGGPSPGYLIAL